MNIMHGSEDNAEATVMLWTFHEVVQTRLVLQIY